MSHLLNIQFDRIDILSWILVFLFFALSALLFQGELLPTLWGAGSIVVLMFLISYSIDLILGVLRNHPKAGELTGYITNGPEALCVLIGLIHGKLLFSAGVPLGSNFANPILLTLAALLAGQFMNLFGRRALATGVIFLGTMGLAAAFYVDMAPSYLWVWAGATLLLSLLFYKNKGNEELPEEEEHSVPPIFIIPAVLLLVVSGYFLDPAVSYTASHSHVPEGVISFVVLSFLSSWPEFRSASALFKMNRVPSALINILVSNLTNLWLAVTAVVVYLLFP